MGHLTVATATVYPHFESINADRIKTRDILGNKGLIGSNATSSLVDECLNTHRKSNLTKMEKDQLKDWKFILNKSKDAIEQHFEKRVSQLFMQAVLCYHTDYSFREGHTIHQGLEAHHLGDIKFNAAHHATVPCLYALSKSTKQEVVFLYRSGFYDESNATIDIIKQVNEADRAIDEKTKTSLLRRTVVALLNKASEAKLTPPEVIRKFIESSINEIDKAIQKETEEVIDVLKLYRKQAENLINYVDDPENIDRWLNLNMDDPVIIQPGITNQELIKKKIDDLPVVIHQKRHQDKTESHIPCHFHDLYLHRVLSQFEDKELKILEKTLDIKFEDLDRKVKSFRYVIKTKALIEQHAEKINQLKTEILPLIPEKQDQPVKEEHLSFSSAKTISLRPSLYRLRYTMLACDHKVQSTIKSLFDKTLNDVKKDSRAHHFDDFFYHFILNQAKNDSDRLILSKLLNVSPTALKQKIREIKVNEAAHNAISYYASDLCRLSDKIRENKLSDKDLKKEISKVVKQISDSSKADRFTITSLCYSRLYDRVENLEEKLLLKELIGSKESIDDLISQKTKETTAEKIINGKSKEIKKTIKTTFEEIAKLNEKTHQYKSKLLLELREANGMSQKHFIEQYNKKFIDQTINNAQLIDFEKARTSIPNKTIQQSAKVYGISPTLFFPSHFAEQIT